MLRSDAETKRVLEELTEKLNEAQKQDVVSDRVERRLQEIEREMRLERELVERRHDQLGLVSLKLQEVCAKCFPGVWVVISSSLQWL